MVQELNKMKITIKNPDNNNYLYLPLVNNKVKSCITPDGHGDNKLSQEHFLLEPVSVENLHSSMVTRNFWCKIKGYGSWSAFGYSAKQKSNREKEDNWLNIGPFWQEVKRKNLDTGIASSVISFCPTGDECVEIMIVSLKNEGDETLEITPVSAIPVYGRGADRIRDHRHVTSLLNRTKVTKFGVTVTPSMSFDEKGHHENDVSYSVYGKDEYGVGPEGVTPLVEEFIGKSGSYIEPHSLEQDEVCLRKEGYEKNGYESIGALWFPEISILPGETHSYIIIMSYNNEGLEYLQLSKALEAFDRMKEYWDNAKLVSVRSFDKDFDRWMDWISLQPELRRIYGCSFLPYHDYGRGGRGWRDLWQDCLALILMKPEEIRKNLADFFAGVRIDGTNATIIGNKPGEFIADRNSIVRVWMDHAYWPLRTVSLYLEQTGDYEFLLEKRPYFRDQIIHRGEGIDFTFGENSGNQLVTQNEEVYYGTLLEHLILQHLVQFYDVGIHNHMRLRGADWNDALDMAEEHGESVAFTAAYGGNLLELAELCELLVKKGNESIPVFEELEELLCAEEALYENREKKVQILAQYCTKSQPGITGRTKLMSIGELGKVLRKMGNWICNHIRKKEIVGDEKGNSWFNGYYDNDGEQLEGLRGSSIRMMLISQVFTILSKTAENEQVEQICKAADQYLYNEKAGGYRLNTDFKENSMNMGRMFGFAYGHKENGAVFCHMAVMYAYALYSRGFVKEGYRVLETLKNSSMDFERSGIYPSIPEYFTPDGRGMYTYLTGAGSWMVLTVLTQMFGVRGKAGDLLFSPKLLKKQFDYDGSVEVRCFFAGRMLNISYINKSFKEFGDYEIEEIFINGKKYVATGLEVRIKRSYIEALPENTLNKIIITLN